MPANESLEVQADGDRWVLNPGPFLFHNAHIQEEAGSVRKNCGICERSMEALFSPVEVPKSDGEKESVDQSDRTDEKGAAAHSRDNEPPRATDWWY